MKLWPRYLVTAIALAGLALAAAAVVRADTWNLELRRLKSAATSADYIYRTTYPQHFSAQVGPVGKGRIMFSGAKEQADAFKDLVKTEPKYESEYPLRGVVKLGSHQYAFALDAVPEKSEAKQATSEVKEEEPAAECAKPQSGEEDPFANSSHAEAEKTSADSAGSKAKKKQAEPAPPPEPIKYNRLYFDANHNGDLTDDKVLEAKTINVPISSSSYRYAYFNFPTVDVTIDADGTNVDYAFSLGGSVHASRDYSYASVSLTSAAYREGDIVLEGKKRHVVLLDFNSNGRFDDVIAIRSDIRTSDGRVYPAPGDMLLLDPEQGNVGSSNPFDVTSSTNRHNVSKLLNIDGRYYDVKISPAGDKLTLTPSTVPLGSVTHPNAELRALLYGDLGFLSVSGGKDAPVALPEGQWKLASYTIDQTGYREPAENPAEKKAEGKKEESKGSLLGALTKALTNTAAASVRGLRSGATQVSAMGTKDCPTIEVRKGETVALPFGPPYKPVVKALNFSSQSKQREVSLSMSLVGSAGEVCTSLTVNGSPPPPPEFTITDPKGEVVERGTFKYG
jgi:hypothetical protein